MFIVAYAHSERFRYHRKIRVAELGSDQNSLNLTVCDWFICIYWLELCQTCCIEIRLSEPVFHLPHSPQSLIGWMLFPSADKYSPMFPNHPPLSWCHDRPLFPPARSPAGGKSANHCFAACPIPVVAKTMQWPVLWTIAPWSGCKFLLTCARKSRETLLLKRWMRFPSALTLCLPLPSICRRSAWHACRIASVLEFF